MRICCCNGGRVAEEKIFDMKKSPLVRQAISKWQRLARAMVRWGMSDKLGLGHVR